jgi:uncharacterized protein
MRLLTLSIVVGLAAPVLAAPTPPLAPDIPPQFTPRTPANDFERRDVMIAMRDGVKLHTVIVVPKGARRAPLVLTRTPYNATKRAERTPSGAMVGSVAAGDELLSSTRTCAASTAPRATT